MVTRRTFFKSLGAIVGCGAVAPSVSLERLQYLDFVPGRQLRHALRVSVSVPEVCPVRHYVPEYWQGRMKLVEWLRGRVPERFRYGRPEFVWKFFDFGNQLGIAIKYDTPKQPS